MEHLFQSSLPWLLVSMSAVVLLLLVPLVGTRARTAIAALLALGAVVAVGFAALAGGTERSLEVVNPFPQGTDGQGQVLVFEQVTAPGWLWLVALAGMLALAAAVVMLSRKRQAPPGLVFHALLVTAWLLVARLLFEKTAAPSGLVWATGVSMAIFPTVVFVGLYAARRGLSFGRFALGLLVLAILQRLLIVAASYTVTSTHAGTHLDMHPLTTMYLPDQRQGPAVRDPAGGLVDRGRPAPDDRLGPVHGRRRSGPRRAGLAAGSPAPPHAARLTRVTCCGA